MIIALKITIELIVPIIFMLFAWAAISGAASFIYWQNIFVTSDAIVMMRICVLIGCFVGLVRTAILLRCRKF